MRVRARVALSTSWNWMNAQRFVVRAAAFALPPSLFSPVLSKSTTQTRTTVPHVPKYDASASLLTCVLTLPTNTVQATSS